MRTWNIGTIFVSGGLVLTVAALAYPAMLGIEKTATGSERIIANTAYGPLTEADRDFVIKVRSAGLWEYPLGEMAMERGTTPEMKEAGEHLVVGHAGLDEMCRKIAPELGITLNNQASPQQQQFVETVKVASDKEFDSTGVTEARDEHGSFYPLADGAHLLACSDPHSALDALREDVVRHAGGPTHDDAAMLLLRYHGHGKGKSHRGD